MEKRSKEASSDKNVSDERAAVESSDMLKEDPEFLASPKKEKTTPVYTDVKRKKEEMKNSTVGGF